MAYVVFDGVDGAGKSTLVKEVNAALRARGDKTHTQAFPSREGQVGKLIRRTFDPAAADFAAIDEKAMLFLFLADAVDLESVTRAALKRGEHVLLDRHTQYTAQAYQTPIHGLRNVDQWTPHSLFQPPDVVCIVDVPPEVAIQRMQAREAQGARRNARYEKHDLDYLTAQRAAYLNIIAAEEELVRVLDGTQPLEQTVKRVIEIIDGVGR